MTDEKHKTQHAGRLFMVTAPSGAGKSSLVNALLAADPAIMLSISHTTRDPRPGEVNGREYHFVSVAEFEERKAHGEFLESALVHGNYYGTSRVWIEEQMAAGAEIAHAPEFEFVIINDSFETALSQLKAIVTASRLTYRHQAVRHRAQFVSLGVPV